MATRKRIDEVVPTADVSDVDLRKETGIERFWRLVATDLNQVLAVAIVLLGFLFSGAMIAFHEKLGHLFTGPFFALMMGAAAYLGYHIGSKNGGRGRG